ncbi:hypothetical protein KM799_12495 [Clostridium tyrobutyricum]|uniref:hypothetical protein n=1 Tax=Clostridium tyrobutyricum TaxID=1519 RepID=UPI001C381CA8|nr:hypothetical protein [Clostridium tyrobutyricum]MBV4447424.1 hypothetical protein [Clostridium tyrobutyricum]
MKTTANYGLKKPDGTDVVDIQNFNDNADTIDTQLKKINDNAGALSGLKTTAKNTLVAAINEVFQSGTNVKSGAISAVNTKGGNLSTSATWDQIIAAIKAIARGQGNAVESQVLSGITFSNSDGQLRTGNMPNKGAVTITPGTADQGIPAGYHNGSGKVKGDANLIASNILKDKSIFNVAGSIDLSNLKSENVKKDVNINGTIGTLEERFSTFDYMKNLNASYVLLNVLPEGAYCQNPSVQRSCYLINQSGSVLKTITNSDATYYPFLVTSDKIFWQKASYYIVVSDKNGTTLQTVQLTYQPRGGVKLENNQYIIIDSSGYIYLFDENFNQIRKWTSGAYELLGIFTKGTDCFFIMQTSNSIIRSYYLDTTSNNGPFLVGYNNGNKNVLQYLN